MTNLPSRIASVATPLATSAPPAAGLDSVVGDSNRAARENHTHTSRVQRTVVTLNAAGIANWTFPRAINAMPSMSYMVVEVGGTQPILCSVNAWINSGSVYTGVQIKAYRAQNLPSLTSVSGLLTAVITGINSLVTALSNFNVFGGSNLNGVQVCLIAAEQT